MHRVVTAVGVISDVTLEPNCDWSAGAGGDALMLSNACVEMARSLSTIGSLTLSDQVGNVYSVKDSFILLMK
jgi:hypothetical protein